MVIETPQGQVNATLNLEQEGDVVRGVMQGPSGSRNISNVSISGSDVRFTVPVDLGGETREATFTGTLSGNEIRGQATVEGRPPANFTARRRTPVANPEVGVNQ
jgi:hypothetical protein